MRGVLVIDNSARGMGKGGTRMSPTLTVREVARLARTMTWKWAAVDLFHGGAKAGILGDPNAPNKEEVLRAFARALANEVPSEYVFGLDMGLTEKDAAIFVDELGDRGAAVGLPRALGGLPYDELGVTGYGVAEAADAAAQAIDLPIAGARVAIQGFGAVGQAAAERLVELGAVDHRGLDGERRGHRPRRPRRRPAGRPPCRARRRLRARVRRRGRRVRRADDRRRDPDPGGARGRDRQGPGQRHVCSPDRRGGQPPDHAGGTGGAARARCRRRARLHRQRGRDHRGRALDGRALLAVPGRARRPSSR